jgi:hypothetical protein
MIGIYPSYKEGKGSGKNNFFDVLKKAAGLDIIPFTCGRSAMVAGLRACGLDRMDEVLVPPYLGQCLLSALSRTSFPTMTSSDRTKAILVFHQFGFPQDIDEIESRAESNGWIILNDCANTLFTRVQGRILLEWGDFSISSFSKLYACGLGGGLFSKRPDVLAGVSARDEKSPHNHIERTEQAFEKLIKINSGYFGDGSVYEINSLYGYLPDLVSFPQKAFSALPSTLEEISNDLNHRKKIWSIIKEAFPDRVPHCEDDEVVPFAIPVRGDDSELEVISQQIIKELSLDAPVLHFDFARNMLIPDYRPSLVIGCHKDWDEASVQRICFLIKNIF